MDLDVSASVNRTGAQLITYDPRSSQIEQRPRELDFVAANREIDRNMQNVRGARCLFANECAAIRVRKRMRRRWR